MPSAAPTATSPPSRRAALRTNIKTSLENCALRFLVVVDAHHMGSADRCQAPGIPHPKLECRVMSADCQNVPKSVSCALAAGEFRVQAANKCRAASAKRQRGF